MEETLRVLVALAITVFLVILRFEAEDFGAAEYDEPTRDGQPRLASAAPQLDRARLRPRGRPDRRPPGRARRPRDRARRPRGGAPPGLRVRCPGDAPGGRVRLLPLRADPLPSGLDLPGRRAQRARDGVHRRGDLPRRGAGVAPAHRGQPGHGDRDPGLPLHARDADRGAGPGPLHVRAHPGRRARGRLAHGHDRGDRGGLPGSRHHPDRLSSSAPATRASPLAGARRSRRPGSTAQRRAAGDPSTGRTMGVPRSRERQPASGRRSIRPPAAAPAGPLPPRPVLPLALPVLRLRGGGRRSGHRPAQPGRGVRGGPAARDRPARDGPRRGARQRVTLP